MLENTNLDIGLRCSSCMQNVAFLPNNGRIPSESKLAVYIQRGFHSGFYPS